ncbi:MAG: proprotein convertase P-domain-containing protein [Akkermansiaceae bacterium]|nr:proprotein convertase P-domain-containing protein [Akkermansiaceae bacterium]
MVVCAPSNGVLGITTVDRTGSNGYNTASSANGGDYTNDFGGTSSATPTAAGIVALMLEKNPNLGWRDVQEILIQSAYKVQPSDSGWATNSGGHSFHHEFGAGLIDATAAVNLAAGWSNLTGQTSTTSAQTGLSVSIPENNSAGITRSFDLAATSLRVEQVTLTLSASHTARGNLEVILTSPGGMSSRLAEVHSDTGNNYSSWKFSSVRHWGEMSTGTWTLKIADRSGSGNSNGGTLTAATLQVFGTPGVPVNPPPVVQITSPSDGQVFSPGATVDISVSASDLTATGDPGVVTGVELFADGASIGTDTTAPYQFSWMPSNGSHTLVAKATDDESALGSSASLNIDVLNQAPSVTAVTLDASGQQFSDTPLAITSIIASDPESASLGFTYQWQSCDNGVSFADEPSETADTLSVSPAHAAKLWRCVVTASDGEVSSAPFASDAVNLLFRPLAAAAAGESYSHQSGLVLRGTENTLSRRAIIHEFSQGPVGSASEWVEILTLQDGSLAYWDIQDAAGNIIVFLDDPVWDDIPAGTLIVVYNGASKDPLLPADDGDPSDGRMVVSSTDPLFFDPSYDAWPSLGNSGDSIFLSDDAASIVHSVAYGNSTATTPNVGSVGSGKSAYYTGNTDEGADLASNWYVTNSVSARKLARAAGDLFISEYVEGSSSNKALEFYNPSGTAVNLSAETYVVEIYANGASSPNSTTNLTGTVAPGGTFVIKNNQASSTIAAQQTSGNISFNGNDAIVLKKGGVIVDSFGQVGINPGSAWTSGGVTTVDKTLRRISSVATGDTVANDTFDPSLEWTAFNLDDFSGLGSHTIDSGSPYFTVSVTPNTFPENAGAAAATGTVTVSEAPESDLTVTLVSSNPGEAAVPASVVIPGGQTSASFAVDAVDDSDTDGSQAVTITASAPDFTDGGADITVTDDEAPLEGCHTRRAQHTCKRGVRERDPQRFAQHARVVPARQRREHPAGPHARHRDGTAFRNARSFEPGGRLPDRDRTLQQLRRGRHRVVHAHLVRCRGG